MNNGASVIKITVDKVDGVANTKIDLTQANMTTYELIGVLEMIKQDLIKASRERAKQKTKTT